MKRPREGKGTAQEPGIRASEQGARVGDAPPPAMQQVARRKIQMVNAADLPAPPKPKVSKPRIEQAATQQQQQQQQRGGKQPGGYRRPTGAKRPAPQSGAGNGGGSAAPVAEPVAANSRFERLERGVISGATWGIEEVRAGPDSELVEIPARFGSFEEYTGNLEPLMIDEAREGARNEFGEACQAGKCHQIDIMNVQALPGSSDWHAVSARFRGAQPRDGIRDGSLVVLLDRKPPRTRDAADWVAGQLQGSKVRAQNGAVGRTRDEGGEGGGGREREGGELGVAMAVVRQPPDRRRLDFQLHIHPSPLERGWVNPAQAMAARPEGWWMVPAGDLITVRREIDALLGLADSTVVDVVLDPNELAKKHSAGQQIWPQEVATEGYHAVLQRKFDFSQLKAIEDACAHLSHPDFGGVAGPEAQWMPFNLIQGPPGTGKTHTVRGILNTWHLVQYQRYYDSLVSCLAPASSIAKHWRQTRKVSSSGTTLHDILSGRTLPSQLDEVLMYLPGVQPRPRVLVCAPSNAATDELLQRVMDDGFRASNGSIYRPTVVRVGSGSAPLSQRARDVWLEALVNQYLSAQSIHDVQAKLQEFRRDMNIHLDHLRQRCHFASQPQADADGLATELAQIYDAWYKCRQEITRLDLVIKHMQTGDRRYVMDLELELVEHAEIIFTTLSSSGRNIFGRMKDRKYMRIHTVLIDEACQACEVAALQPLMYGCKKCVLVGDPQQLPATVLSMRAKARLMERSLFERLQQGGCPVHMLMVQYRMHPMIRQFPSSHFYENKLKDGKIVEDRVDPAFYRHCVLKPYIFFDVNQGRESRAGGRSVSNQAEADMAAALYVELLHELEKTPDAPPVSVGVITPYRDQRECLKRTFREVCGADLAEKVFIETVDSFQGKQLDVVMLSCVRASAKKSRVGFVGDIRRMNVAITRAMVAMWVLGDAATLRSSPEWAALIDDARGRGCIIGDADARVLFPLQFGFAGDGRGPHHMLGSLAPPLTVPPPPQLEAAPAQQPLTHSAPQQVMTADPRSRAMAAWGGSETTHQPPVGGPLDPRSSAIAAWGGHNSTQPSLDAPSDPRASAMAAWGGGGSDAQQAIAEAPSDPRVSAMAAWGGGAADVSRPSADPPSDPRASAMAAWGCPALIAPALWGDHIRGMDDDGSAVGSWRNGRR